MIEGDAKEFLDADSSWLLNSGNWTAQAASSGYVLQRTSLGLESSSLSAADLQKLFASVQSDSEPQALFPPEFRFSPYTGEALAAAGLATPSIWVGPFGSAAASERGLRTARGLRQSVAPLKLLDKGR